MLAFCLGNNRKPEIFPLGSDCTVHTEEEIGGRTKRQGMKTRANEASKPSTRMENNNLKQLLLRWLKITVTRASLVAESA